MPHGPELSLPTITVVMPLMRHRGQLQRALEAWQEQDYPREQIEFVFVSNLREPGIDEQLARCLAGEKRLRGGPVYIRTDNVMAQFQYGARYARGEWLLFQEPHVTPRPNCLRELMGGLSNGKLAAGCVTTSGECDSQTGVGAAPIWHKFTPHGFAIRRDVYRWLGGIEAERGWLAGPILSARLAASAMDVAEIPSAIVDVSAAASRRETFDTIWNLHSELARYQHDGSELVRPYLRELAQSTPGAPARHAMQYFWSRVRLACLSLTAKQTRLHREAAAAHLAAWAEAKHEGNGAQVLALHLPEKPSVLPPAQRRAA